MNSCYKNCRLCPRQCGIDRTSGETGYCGSGDKIKIARAALHYWEEPCISGETGSGAVFFSGCTLGCVYCQNYDISKNGKGYDITDYELAEEFLRLRDNGAANINLVTPSHYVPGIISSLEIAKNKGLDIPIVYNCGGYESVETLKMLDGYVDIYLPDMKYYSDKYAVCYSSAKRYFEIASAAVSEMYRQTGRCEFDENGMMKSGVIIRHLLLPGLLFESKKIIDYLFKNYGDNIWISLMSQYTPLEHVKNIAGLNRRIPKAQYDSLVNYCMDKGMTCVYIQNNDSADKCYVPEFFDKKFF